MPVEHLTRAIEDRAVQVQLLLADRGQHRAPSIPDLIIAATGELARLIVLHIDRDFEVIADVTGHSVERLSLWRETKRQADAVPEWLLAQATAGSVIRHHDVPHLGAGVCD